ncbi:hypothetical protein YH65_07595 [Sulfurovum lithotrophicum]|uniref:Glycosyltransferase subfamily 4-like N-terminal domain-containing protein n=1 Tax=Sulfurovum lithotrophicum TaxID=206403 RepID=A0A7U4M1Q1_9BACT|nr:glycosyltransferase [Sulfurovum lithotrophicum]AKF25268.1 hypothetical protein YH65_07595 [Sulfurovum lithotrophicum]
MSDTTNTKTDTSWLILSHAAAKPGSAVSNHIDDRLPYLKAHGIQPIMLSCSTSGQYNDVPHYRTSEALLPSSLRSRVRNYLKSRIATKWIRQTFQGFALIPILPFYALEKLLLDIDAGWSWTFSVGKKGIALCEEYQPSCIYSTGGSISAHLAAMKIARHAGIPWIAEFQDPLVHDVWPYSRRSLWQYKFIERLICHRAQAVVFLTKAAMEAAQRRTDLGNQGHYIYAGTSPKTLSISPYHKGATMNFSHFGSMGGKRHFGYLFSGLDIVLKENPEWAKFICIHQYGSIDKSAKKIINDSIWKDNVTYHGLVKREIALKHMAETDCLLLIQNPEFWAQETIPAKTFEYLRMGRPILGFLYRNQELFEMLDKPQNSLAQVDDPQAIAKAIKKQIVRWLSDEPFNAHTYTEWTTKDAVDQLVKIAKEISFVHHA